MNLGMLSASLAGIIGTLEIDRLEHTNTDCAIRRTARPVERSHCYFEWQPFLLPSSKSPETNAAFF